MKKFLRTFAAYGPVDAKVVNKGPNEFAPLITEHVMTAQALANADTIDIDAPQGAEDYVPQLVGVWSNATPRVLQTAVAITNHNPLTGITRLTATGTVAQNSTFVVAYYPATKA